MSGLHSPTAVVNWPGNSDIYVVAQRGIGIVSFHDTSLPAPPSGTPHPSGVVLDLSNEARLPGPGYCDEFIGITGLAFHPDFLSGTAKRFFYVRFNLNTPLNTTVIRRYYIRPGTFAAQVSNATDIYTWPTIFQVYSSGQIHFGPSGPATLYFTQPDDSSASSYCPDTVRAQDDLSDLGKLISLAVDDVPITKTILAKGMRNPFGMSVDRGDSNGQGQGDVWISDTGYVPSGSFLRVPSGQSGILNFGWPWQQGDSNLANGAAAALTPAPCNSDPQNGEPSPPPTYTDPARVFSDSSWFGGGHSAVIGSVVYRGTALQGLSNFDGRLVFALFKGFGNPMTGPVFVVPGTLGPGEGIAVDISASIGIGGTLNTIPAAHTILGLTQDIDGEILILSDNCDNSAGKGRITRLKL